MNLLYLHCAELVCSLPKMQKHYKELMSNV